MDSKSDFSKGSLYRHILSLAIPMVLGQLVQLLYNIVDRIYIGHLPGASSLALTGLGLTFPVITIISAFTNLFGMGGAPLFSIARGEGNAEKAENILGNTAGLLFGSAFILMAVCYIFMKPLLYLFGASDVTYPFAEAYLQVYLVGTPLVMLGTGLNGFIGAQGFGTTGMLAVLVGAVTNILLDPIFIFALDMGITGAAVATVLSQLLSAAWVLRFLTGRRALLKIRRRFLRPEWEHVRKILGMGAAGFVMSASNGLMQVACNTTLRAFGGDVYVGVMTVVNSVRDVTFLPGLGFANATQPVIGYNFGAGVYERVKKCIRILSVVSVVYMLLVWLIIFLFPEALIGVFTDDPVLIEKGTPALHTFFFGAFLMSLQMAGQSAFVGLGLSRQAVFFSLLRKVFIVVPLTLLLPYVGSLGADGVFWAEPISNLIGGTACYATMLVTVRKKLTEKKIIG
ncbi:MAG: MATE family efflux transporter [Clostridia bacterium]|nr:MATE family efflux transporter [Clostridia bacterium]